jgi:MFS family permease
VAAVVAPAKPSEREAVGIWRVARRIWRPGLGFFLSTIGYAAIASFLVLLFSSRGWSGGGYALTLFGAGFVGARFILGDRADRADGPRLAILSLGVEMAGLVMIGLASNPSVAFAGAAICGLGVSPIYPLLAVLAIRSGPPDQLGVTIAAYDSCFDLALMLASPAFGILAEPVGLPGIFLLAAIPPGLATLAATVAYRQVPHTV